MGRNASSTGRNQEIEALRGVAILAVLYAHVGACLFPVKSVGLYLQSREWIETGTGVDLFFCISGYVITRRYAAYVPYQSGSANFFMFAVPFWIRRFWRLAPSAVLWLSIGLCTSAYWDPANFMVTLKDALAAVLQVANFHIYECTNKINATVCGPSSIYWSLSLEEQFYLLFPILLFITPRRFLIPLFGGVFAVQFFIPRSFAGLLWLIRTDALALGVIIALLQASPTYQLIQPLFLKSKVARWVWMTCLILLLLILDAPKFHFVEFTVGMVSVISALLVWTASFEKNYATPSSIIKRVLGFFGARSYALYLIHFPAAWLAGPVTVLVLRLDASWYQAMQLPVIFVFAELNFRFVETPLRLYGVRVAARYKARSAEMNLESRQVVAITAAK